MTNRTRRFSLRLAGLVGVVLIALFGSAAFAHPPKEVILSWNPSGTLTVNVKHNVNDPQKHYINKILIFVNDKVTVQKEYTSQQSSEEFHDSFSLGALPPGTKIKAEAFCVIMGSASGSISVP